MDNYVDPFTKIEYKYSVLLSPIHSSETITEIYQWCVDSIGAEVERWAELSYHNGFAFNEFDDVVLFTIAWHDYLLK